MIDLEARLDALRAEGLVRPPRLVSGPQGPRVVLDGRPVLLLGSDGCLGLADHPRVREAAADAAMRWGVGAGGSRIAGGTMTPHRRLEERLAELHDTDAAVLLGCEALAAAAAVSVLAGPGDVVFADARNRSALADACRLSGAEAVAYDDLAALTGGLREAGERAALIVTDGVFAADGASAGLPVLARLARRHGARLLVDETHALGVLGPGGRGAVAAAGLEGEVDAIVGSLGTALGAHGGYVAGEAALVRCLVADEPAFRTMTAPSPVTTAGALAGLELLLEQPRRVEKLLGNAAELRAALAAHGVEVDDQPTHVVALPAPDAASARRLADAALARGIHAPPLADPPALRLTVMASHTKAELREAAATLAALVHAQAPPLRAPALTHAA
jgi:7-keto-8-aminopelargonate synthetase-like enzyme